MPLYSLTLQNKQLIAKNTVLFEFSKPPGLTFTPGQYGGFTLLHANESDRKGNTRRFSITSAPEDETLAIVIRIQDSSFKRILNTLPIGSEIKFAGPTGQFCLHTDETIPAILIAGGVGIAPFHSIIRHTYQSHSKREIYLFYGNSTLETTVFFNELTEIADQHPSFKFIPTFDHPEQRWQGETGFITHTLIKKYFPDVEKGLYYVCGAPVMVTTLQETLIEMGIEPDNIKVEDFPGY